MFAESDAANEMACRTHRARGEPPGVNIVLDFTKGPPRPKGLRYVTSSLRLTITAKTWEASNCPIRRRRLAFHDGLEH
jgi:hypothetical protein